ncbi:hypothetical protein [Rhizobium sp.]
MTEATLPPVGLFEDFCVDDPAVLRGYAEAMYDHLHAVGPGGSDERFTRDDLRRGTIWLVGCYHTFGLPPCADTLALVAAFVGAGLSKTDAEVAALRAKFPHAFGSGVQERLWPAFDRAVILEAQLVRDETRGKLFSASSYAIAKTLLDEGLMTVSAKDAPVSKQIERAEGTIRGWRKRDHYRAMVQMLRENISRNWTP